MTAELQDNIIFISCSIMADVYHREQPGIWLFDRTISPLSFEEGWGGGRESRRSRERVRRSFGKSISGEKRKDEMRAVCVLPALRIYATVEKRVCAKENERARGREEGRKRWKVT